MLLQPPVHGAAAQSQGLGGLADVSRMTGKRALDEILLHFVEAHLLELGGGATDGLGAQAEVRCANAWPGGKKHASFDRMVQFAHIPGPGMLMESFEGRRIETCNVFAIALSIAVEEMVRQEVDIVAPVAQWGQMNLDGIQAKKKVLPKPACGRLRVYVRVGGRQNSHVHAARG